MKNNYEKICIIRAKVLILQCQNFQFSAYKNSKFENQSYII